MGSPKGFPRAVGRVGSRLYGFSPFPQPGISTACSLRELGTQHWTEAHLRAVELSEFHVVERDAIEVFLHLFEAEVFVEEYFADKDSALVPTYIAASHTALTWARSMRVTA